MKGNEKESENILGSLALRCKRQTEGKSKSMKGNSIKIKGNEKEFD